MTPSLCVSVASLRSTQEEYQRKALGAFQRLGLSHAALFSHLHPHFPQNHCVTAQLYRLTECEQTALSLYFYQSFIFTCIICTVRHLSYAVYAVTSYHEYVLKVKFILEKSFSNTHTLIFDIFTHVIPPGDCDIVCNPDCAECALCFIN